MRLCVTAAESKQMKKNRRWRKNYREREMEERTTVATKTVVRIKNGNILKLAQLQKNNTNH